MITLRRKATEEMNTRDDGDDGADFALADVMCCSQPGLLYENADKQHRVALHDLEASACMALPSLTSLTLLRGKSWTAVLKERCQRLLRSNAWVLGRLAHRNELILEWDDYLYGDEDALMAHETTTLVTTQPYDELVRAVAARKTAVLPAAEELVDGRDSVLKITLFPTETDDVTAMCVSAASAVFDGATYYAILSMLATGLCRPLRVYRQLANFQAVAWTMLGGQQQGWLASSAVKLNVAARRGNASPTAAVLVDTNMLPERVNDVLTSALGKATEARVVLMRMNLRAGSGLRDVDAGNYEGATVLTDFDTPATITGLHLRGPPFCTDKVPLPGWIETVSCGIAQIVNYVHDVFDGGFLDDHGQDACDLHIPLVSNQVTPFPTALVFKPRRGTKCGVLLLNCASRNPTPFLAKLRSCLPDDARNAIGPWLHPPGLFVKVLIHDEAAAFFGMEAALVPFGGNVPVL